jgi:AcrR family transcriptional regulator
MSPRRYRMRARQASAEETRCRIVEAARRLLSTRGGIGALTVDAVATRADVARMTVYHQFGSKTALIEAVFDSLDIVRTGVPRLVAALALPDPLDTLAEFVVIFADVWQTDRVVIRRLQGLAAIDRREARRREGLGSIARRIAARSDSKKSDDVEILTDVLFALIAFETYDVIAGPKRRFETIVSVVQQLAFKAAGVGEAAAVTLRPARKATPASKSL